MWFRKKQKKRFDSDIPRLPNVYIQDSVVAQTEASLNEVARDGSCHEKIVYWCGKDSGTHQVVMTAIVPAAITTEGSFKTSASANARVIQFLAENGLEIVGQVHSHPGTWVDHSDGDNEGALMPFEGFISIVVPSYCRYGMLPLKQCGVHRFENGRFRRMADREVEQAFRMIPSFHQLR